MLVIDSCIEFEVLVIANNILVKSRLKFLKIHYNMNNAYQDLKKSSTINSYEKKNNSSNRHHYFFSTFFSDWWVYN